MKIIIHGPLAGYGWDGTIHSWAPDTLVELDDSNATQVAWGKSWVGMGATLVEDVAKPAKPAAKAATSTAKTTK